MIMLYAETSSARGLTPLYNASVTINAAGALTGATFADGAANPVGTTPTLAFDANTRGELRYYFGVGY